MLTKKQIDCIKFIKNNILLIAHRLGFTKLIEINAKHIYELLFGKEDRTDLWHRGSFKTTDVSIAMALHIILKPNINIIFLRKTDSDVAEVVTQVSNILKTDYMQGIAFQLYGVGIDFLTENKTELNTTLNTSTRGVSQLVGVGIGGNLTGKHAWWIHTDDIVNLKDRLSRAEREKVKLIYQELQNIKNIGGKITNTCTPWHNNDATTLMPNKHFINCYESGILSKIDIENLRKNMSPSLFSANYELKHIVDENALFKTEPKYFSDIKLLENGIGHIDASYGGADSSAFTLANKKGNNIYLFGKKYSKHIDNCLDEIISLTKKYKCGTIWTERNADKGYVSKLINSKGHLSDTYHEDMNKYLKISTYLKVNWNNVYFHDETDVDYIQEIMDYTEFAQHDDCPDSSASIIRKLEKKIVIV